MAADHVVGAGGTGLSLGRGLGPGGVRPEPTPEHRRLREHGGTAGHQPGHPDPGGHPGERRAHRPDRSEPEGQGRPAAQGRIPGDADHGRSAEAPPTTSPSRPVQSPKFEQLWVTVNRAASKQLVAVLTGSSEGSVSTKNGKITIDLSKVEANVKEKLDAKGITVFDKVPAAKGLNYVLFQSKDLVRIQKLVNFLNKLAVVLPIITLLCFAGAVVLTRNRRKGLVRAGIGLALSMGLILVVIAVLENQYVAGVKPPQSPQAAVRRHRHGDGQPARRRPAHPRRGRPGRHRCAGGRQRLGAGQGR